MRIIYARSLRQKGKGSWKLCKSSKIGQPTSCAGWYLQAPKLVCRPKRNGALASRQQFFKDLYTAVHAETDDRTNFQPKMRSESSLSRIWSRPSTAALPSAVCTGISFQRPTAAVHGQQFFREFFGGQRVVHCHDMSVGLQMSRWAL